MGRRFRGIKILNGMEAEVRVLQLIDTLRSGGAEKMAVNYANALSSRVRSSYLCCTRKEGLLKKQLSPEVGYLFLRKKSTLDFRAFRKLRNFVIKNEIDIIQAHSSSWFLALLVVMSSSKVKIVWHDHYGRQLEKRRYSLLFMMSSYFDGIISVNSKLRFWAEGKLRTKKVKFFPNFLAFSEDKDGHPDSSKVAKKNSLAQGSENGFKIVCLANLRPQKDHMTLLKAFLLIDQKIPVSLHLIGKDFQDLYSMKVKTFINDHSLEEKVFFYGEVENVDSLLVEADIGVLSSISEGLPVALLEYGKAGIPVVATDVGEIAEVIRRSGQTVAPGDPMNLAAAVEYYLRNETQRNIDAMGFKEIVRRNYSEDAVVPSVVNFFEEVRCQP